jgi:hypothetical protein
MVSTDITRLPVRLVQEDGNTIKLDVTSMDITVERSNSQIAVPFRDGQRFGIDLNMPQISVALAGKLADDKGTNVPGEGAKAEMDFGSSVFSPSVSTAVAQTLTFPARGNNNNIGSGGGSTVGAWLPLTPFGRTNLFAAVQSVNDLASKYFELPVSFLASDSANALGRPTAPVTGMKLHLKADVGVSEAFGKITAWGDQSGNAYNFSATGTSGVKRPVLHDSQWNGYPAARFVNTNTETMKTSFQSDLNPDAYTGFVVFAPRSNSGAAGPIIGNTHTHTVTGTNSGFSLHYTGNGTGAGDNDFQFRVRNDSGVQVDVDGEGQTLTEGYGNPEIVMFQVTGSASAADQTVSIRIGGKLSADKDTGLALLPADTGDWQLGRDEDIGASNYAGGQISEIIFYDSALSTADIEKNEGYLAGKYGLSLDSDHIYYGASVQNATNIRIYCDTWKKGSAKEPHYFLNHQRATDLVVNTYSAGTGTVTVSSGNPLSWFDVTVDSVAKDASSAAFGRITSVTSTTFIIDTTGHTGPTPSSGNVIHITPFSGQTSRHYPDNQPVISIPVKDLLAPSTLYADATRRNLLGARNPAELFAVRIKKALESTDSLGTLPLIEDGSTNAGGVFTVKILGGANGYLTRLEIEQRRKVAPTSTGVFLNPAVYIHSTLIANNERPVIHHFTGGRESNNVKSAGDKAQDLIGVLNNSQNTVSGNANTGTAPPAAWALTDALQGLWGVVYDPGDAADYVYGIQIPYLSTVNKNSEVVTNNFPQWGSATASGSTTIITSSGTHGLVVGDMIDISYEFNWTRGISLSLIGEHTVSSITSTTEFVVSTNSSANVDSGSLALAITVRFMRKFVDHNAQYLQRNFFLTVGDVSTNEKTSVANITPAKTAFDLAHVDHRRSGIQIAVDQFNVDFNAEDRLYEFDLTMLAVDHLF